MPMDMKLLSVMLGVIRKTVGICLIPIIIVGWLLTLIYLLMGFISQQVKRIVLWAITLSRSTKRTGGAATSTTVITTHEIGKESLDRAGISTNSMDQEKDKDGNS